MMSGASDGVVASGRRVKGKQVQDLHDLVTVTSRKRKDDVIMSLTRSMVGKTASLLEVRKPAVLRYGRNYSALISDRDHGRISEDMFASDHEALVVLLLQPATRRGTQRFFCAMIKGIFGTVGCKTDEACLFIYSSRGGMNMRKKPLGKTAVILTLALGMALTGCGSGDKASTEATENGTDQATTATVTEADTEKTSTAAATEAETDQAVTEASTDEPASGQEEDEEDYNTGDASLDNIRNQDEIGDKELLVISFGTSFNDSRRLTIGAIEQALEDADQEYSVRRGFTADIVIDHVERRDKIHIDNVDEALDRAMKNNVKTLVVQPTHLMNGIEYDELSEKVAKYSDAFEKVVIGQPLLSSDDDFQRVEKAITDWTKEYDDGETAIVFMGHGTEHSSNAVYQKMQDLLTKDGFKHYYIGTVEATPSLDDVREAVKKGGYKRVVLEPLMVVAGDHANNDMAGSEDDSWKTAFEKDGYEVVCLLRGLGENEDIRQIYVDHAKAAIDSLQ